MNAVSNVVGVLDEEEDTGAGEFGDGAGECEGEGHDTCSVGCEVLEEIQHEKCTWEIVSYFSNIFREEQ